MTNEARIFAEGSLRWTVASGTGQSWVTASAPTTGLIGYVQVGTVMTQTDKRILVSERGIPDHWKNAGRDAVTLKIKFLQANTGQYPPTSVTAPGASLPMLHMELKHDMKELGGPTAQFYQFINGVRMPNVWTEAENGNSLDQTWSFINVVGPTGSGYLATGGQ
jgi:hypothetical protein